MMVEGGCTCGAVRYRLTRAPLFTHCCHCTWCQRETGSAFVLNALIEAVAVETLTGAPAEVLTPSASGAGQRIFRCPACQVALWSIYPGAGPKILFVRAGTLDDPDTCPPDIHIFTVSKLDWVLLPEGVAAVPEFYDYADLWSAESLERIAAARSA